MPPMPPIKRKPPTTYIKGAQLLIARQAPQVVQGVSPHGEFYWRPPTNGIALEVRCQFSRDLKTWVTICTNEPMIKCNLDGPRGFYRCWWKMK